jgi:ankyrin repeat protein
MNAAINNYEDICKLLLDSEKVSIQVINQEHPKFRTTAFSFAARNGCFNALKAFLEHKKVDTQVITYTGSLGTPAISLAVQTDKGKEIIKLFLDNVHVGIKEINQEDEKGWTALSIAAIQGRLDVLKAFFEHSKVDDRVIQYTSRQNSNICAQNAAIQSGKPVVIQLFFE